jgi:hypothetical protein
MGQTLVIIRLPKTCGEQNAKHHCLGGKLLYKNSSIKIKSFNKDISNGPTQTDARTKNKLQRLDAKRPQRPS